MSNLFEPNFERGVEDRDERDGLLAGTLSNREEVSLVLCGNELGRSCRIFLKELLDERMWLVEGGKRLKDRGDVSATVGAGESLLDTAKPITSEIPEGEIDPSVLVRHVHEANHPKDGLLVGHVAEILGGCTVLLPSKPGFLEVFVEFSDNLCPTFCQPGGSFLLGQGEDGVVELFPQRDSTGGNLVDRFSQLGANGQNTAGFLVICTFPLRVGDARSSNDEIFDGGGGVCLLGDHDSRRK